MIADNWLVSTVLETRPQVMLVFKNMKLDCLGCEMAVYCTISDVVREYSLDRVRFLQDLNHIISTAHESQER